MPQQIGTTMTMDGREVETLLRQRLTEAAALPKEQRERYLARLKKVVLALPRVTNDGDLGRLVAEIFAPPAGYAGGGLQSVDHLITHAKQVWRAAGAKGGLSDMELLEPLQDRLRLTPSADAILSILCILRWYEVNFPVLKISARFAAAAMVTSVATELQEELQPPWPAFLIELPKEESVLYQYDMEGAPFPVRWIQVLHSTNPGGKPGCWSIFLHSSGTAVVTSRTLITIPQMLSFLEAIDPLGDMAEKDDRAGLLAGRIVVSTICAATNIDLTGRGNVGFRPSYKRGRDGMQPTARIFKITEPVEIDLVPAVQKLQLSKHTGKLLTIQSVVRGHRKQQPCGPGHVDRKLIWIQPYWRGPEDAPIAVRPHILKDGPAKE